jgi:hypothetical protein
MIMWKKLLAILMVFISFSGFASNPISKFEIQLSEEISFGLFYPIMEVTFEIMPDSNFTIEEVHFLLTSVDLDSPILDTWVILNQPHLQCTHYFDSVSRKYVFNFGMIELPPNYECIAKAKDNNWVIYQDMEPF